MKKIIQFVAGMVEGRDPALAEHHDNLGESAALLAQHLGYSSRETDLLCFGARVHDVGKLSLSDHILNKPARLTAVEFSLVMEHPRLGRDLLAPLDLDPRITEIVCFHHENFDGSGYPEGLKGEAIPLFARIVRILDSFDAMTMDRPYHQSVSPDEALRLMENDARCYDPALLSPFCEVMRRSCLA
ncbi:HD-GYP domain-containing protein [Thioalkalivibrio thiocyanodenitrificans]|uniref:HD-GYP domain-containing protein n=1 Tax=Thioalkalivibrio thiocyanodenitrificans TaxID=243063 RepID=UPI00037B423B|nr:HD domain-containing phosphohydrolase [Thioalkalivibrio thiocyanodenitrificans]